MKKKETIEVLETIKIGSSRTEHEAIDKAVKAIKNTKKEYKRGLEDAWECVRKILDMDDKESERVFGMKFFDGEKTPIDVFSAQEAMQKIKEYELIEQHYYEERQNVKKYKCDTCRKFGDECDGNSLGCGDYEEKTEIIKCNICKYKDSSFSPCIKCKDDSEFEPIEERQTTNLCDKCAKTKCSVKMQLEEQNIKLKGCDFYEDKENYYD